MQHDGVRRAAAGPHEIAVHHDGRERSRESDHEAFDALVGDEQVRSEAYDGNAQTLMLGERQRLLELGQPLGRSQQARGAAGAERRVARERDVPLDLHASASKSTGTAPSTSPAPTVITTSPARARLASQRAPRSADGIHATRVPPRASDTASTTIFPRTSPSCSRAA